MNSSLKKMKIDRDKRIADFLNIKFAFYDLKKLDKKFVNAFEISKNLVYFYPSNDGIPTCKFEFYKNSKLVIDNCREYSQISNLDEILLEMVRIFNKSIDNKIVLDPYCFMLELVFEPCENYHGPAKLVITDAAIRNKKIDERDIDSSIDYFINCFLDHFIGWNFGLSVNRSNALKEELNALNDKVIDMGIRKWAGPGFEVHGVIDHAINGLQHYSLPIEKNNDDKKSKK